MYFRYNSTSDVPPVSIVSCSSNIFRKCHENAFFGGSRVLVTKVIGGGGGRGSVHTLALLG